MNELKYAFQIQLCKESTMVYSTVKNCKMYPWPIYGRCDPLYANKLGAQTHYLKVLEPTVTNDMINQDISMLQLNLNQDLRT